MTAATFTVPSLQEVVVLDAWQVYRRSQRIPFPETGAGELIMAQSRLCHYLGPFTRTDNKDPGIEPDVDAIDEAVDALVAAVEWHRGPEDAAFVAGDGEES